MKILTIKKINNLRESNLPSLGAIMGWDNYEDFTLNELKQTLRNLNKAIRNFNLDNKDIDNTHYQGDWTNEEIIEKMNEDIMDLNIVIQYNRIVGNILIN